MSNESDNFLISQQVLNVAPPTTILSDENPLDVDGPDAPRINGVPAHLSVKGVHGDILVEGASNRQRDMEARDAAIIAEHTAARTVENAMTRDGTTDYGAAENSRMNMNEQAGIMDISEIPGVEPESERAAASDQMTALDLGQEYEDVAANQLDISLNLDALTQTYNNLAAIPMWLQTERGKIIAGVDSQEAYNNVFSSFATARANIRDQVARLRARGVSQGKVAALFKDLTKFQFTTEGELTEDIMYRSVNATMKDVGDKRLFQDVYNRCLFIMKTNGVESDAADEIVRAWVEELNKRQVRYISASKTLAYRAVCYTMDYKLKMARVSLATNTTTEPAMQDQTIGYTNQLTNEQDNNILQMERADNFTSTVQRTTKSIVQPLAARPVNMMIGSNTKGLGQLGIFDDSSAADEVTGAGTEWSRRNATSYALDNSIEYQMTHGINEQLYNTWNASSASGSGLPRGQGTVSMQDGINEGGAVTLKNSDELMGAAPQASILASFLDAYGSAVGSGKAFSPVDLAGYIDQFASVFGDMVAAQLEEVCMYADDAMSRGVDGGLEALGIKWSEDIGDLAYKLTGIQSNTGDTSALLMWVEACVSRMWDMWSALAGVEGTIDDSCVLMIMSNPMDSLGGNGRTWSQLQHPKGWDNSTFVNQITDAYTGTSTLDTMSGNNFYAQYV